MGGMAFYYSDINGESGWSAPIKTNVINVTGAGDAMVAGLAETKSSRALDRVPKHCQDLFKDGQMPIPEFETVERPVRKQAEQTQPSRHPKRELKPGYRWKFNGTGAFGRKTLYSSSDRRPCCRSNQSCRESVACNG